jgi:hypothetical protein
MLSAIPALAGTWPYERHKDHQEEDSEIILWEHRRSGSKGEGEKYHHAALTDI